MSEAQKVIVIKGHWKDMRYLLIAEAPYVSPDVSEFYYTICDVTQTDRDGYAYFVIRPESFAIAGVCPTGLSLDYNVCINAHTEVSLDRPSEPSTEVTLAVDENGDPSFSSPKKPERPAFTIKTGKINSRLEGCHYFVGRGKYDNSKYDNEATVVAVSIWEAEGENTQRVSPSNKYYVVRDSIELKQNTVDLRQLDKECIVDFDTALPPGSNVAHITDNTVLKGGTFSSPVWTGARFDP